MHLLQIPGEEFLTNCLQKHVTFSLSNRLLKRGRFLLYKRLHYFIQISMLSERGLRENFDIPIPFKIETYQDEGLAYFDYRVKSLDVENLPLIKEKVSSIYFDKILEIQIINNYTLSCL